MSFCTGLAGFLVLCSWTGVLIRMNTGSGSATCTGFRTKLLRERFAYRLHNIYIHQDARKHPLVFLPASSIPNIEFPQTVKRDPNYLCQAI